MYLPSLKVIHTNKRLFQKNPFVIVTHLVFANSVTLGINFACPFLEHLNCNFSAGIHFVFGPKSRQLRKRRSGKNTSHRRSFVRTGSKYNRKRGHHFKKLLQVAENLQPRKRHSSASPRRCDINYQEGHMRQTKCSLQYPRSRSRGGNVQLRQKLQCE